MKKIGASLLLILAVTNSFGSYRWMHKKKKTGKKTTSAANAASKPGKGISSISFYRGACFGKCPVYTLEVHDNGLVRYIGKSDVEYAGTYEKNFGAANVMPFITKFESYRPDTLQDKYEVRIADFPGLRYTITYRDKAVQTVGNAQEGPDFLKRRAEEMDQLFKVDNTWQKQPDQPAQK